MLLKRIENRIDLNALREDIRKIGINLVTAGIAGVFINHLVGSELRSMMWASLSVTSFGLLAMCLGIMRRRKI
jgi:hypothetical protein